MPCGFSDPTIGHKTSVCSLQQCKLLKCSILGISCLQPDNLPNLSSVSLRMYLHQGFNLDQEYTFEANLTLSPLMVFWFPSQICLGDHEPDSCQTKLEWEVCFRSIPHCTAPQRVLQDQIRASSE